LLATEKFAMTQATRLYTSDLGQLAEMRRFVRDSCQHAWGPDVDEEVLGQIELALQEAASNIILHAYEQEKGRTIELIVDADPDQVCLALYHEGRDFDPGAVPKPTIDASRTGGFGLYLIGQCMDEVRIVHDDSGRRGIRLVKKRTSLPRGEKNMQLLIEKFGEVAVAAVNAEHLDASNAEDFKLEISPVLKDFHKLVLDLGRVQFVDSRGCGVILSCLKSTTEAGGDLRLCRVGKSVRTVFDLIRLHRICEILDTKEQCLQAFQR
jgi:anti-anti-sigma factor